MKDVKGREVAVGDLIWIGRRNRMYGELVARRVLAIKVVKDWGDKESEVLRVEGLATYPDNSWQGVIGATNYTGHGSGFMIDMEDRHDRNR